MCVLAWIYLVHEEGAEPAALGIPGVPPVGHRGRGDTGNDRLDGKTGSRGLTASSASIVLLPGSPGTSLAPLGSYWEPCPVLGSVCPQFQSVPLNSEGFGYAAQPSKDTAVGAWDKGDSPHGSPLSPNGHGSDSDPSTGKGTKGASPHRIPFTQGLLQCW